MPDEQLWKTHLVRKQALIDYSRRRLKRHHLRLGQGSVQMDEFESMHDTNAFIIGFATYKRATLIFRNAQRLQRMLNNPQRRVQIVFAGKAHPADDPGKALIRQVYQLSRSVAYRGKVVFPENYDLEMARYLVSGTDLWLNTPIRPHEASGTSGQKAALNGLPNCSILDGRWAEGYNGKNGWAIGEEREYHDPEIQAEADSLSLYQLLEEVIIPTYHDRGPDGIPHRWIAIMKEAIRTCVPAFSMRRMVKEYTTRFYVPEIRVGMQVEQDHYERARVLATWKEHFRRSWPSLEIFVEGRREGQLSLGEGVDIHAWVRAKGLKAEDLSVELVFGQANEEIVVPQYAIPMSYSKREVDGSFCYNVHLQPSETGSIGYGVRFLPAPRTRWQARYGVDPLGIASLSGSTRPCSWPKKTEFRTGGASPISISGYHIREAGSTAVQEVAFTLYNAISYVQAAIDAGLNVDAFAGRLSFFFNKHNNLLEEVAKFRAARRMWAHLMRDRFHARTHMR